MPNTARDQFLTAFSEIVGTGNFHSTGTAPFFMPQLHVAGLGELAFPLTEAQAKGMIALAEAAPYGKGEQTVFDEKVRKCWQLDASQFTVKSAQWKKFLDQTIASVREDLGINGKVSASPYKLLIYGKGGHFKAHRDTEKLAAMFGTLIVALPSAHQGGRLSIRHDGREIEVDFSRDEHVHEFQHAAFFADCEHEVEPVSSGYRCCLIYNLHLDEGDPGQLNLSLTEQARALLPSLAAMKLEHAGELSAVLLDHSYTEANLSLRNLKGNDQARAHALFAAAEEAGFTAHLALVTFHQSGMLEDGYEYSRHGRYHDDDDELEDGTMGEIYEESLAIDHWRDGSDRSVALGCYRIEQESLISKEEFGEGEPDEKEAEGYTGNAGCTMDYWYRSAAIVLWAREDHERILCQYNFSRACAALAGLAAGENTGPGSPFHRLGEAVVACYTDSSSLMAHISHLGECSGHPFAITLAALAGAEARGLLEELLGKVEASAFALCDAELWSKLHKAFGVEVFEPIYKVLLGEDAEASRRTLFRLLDALLKGNDAASLAQMIAGRLAGLPPKQPNARHWSESRDPVAMGDREETRILLAASHLLQNPGDRRNALAFLRGDSSLPHLRDVLGPVLLDKGIAKCLALDESLAPDVLASARDLLAAELACPLNPYPDWTRPCPALKSKESAPIVELAAFMADPQAETHHFARPEYERSELERFIRQHLLDLSHVTIRKGRPYTLACTKNDMSYQHSLAWRARDKELLDRLGNL